MKIKQWTMAFLAVFCLMGWAVAQSNAVVLQGEKATCHFLTAAQGFRVANMAADGRYLFGKDYMVKVGYMYDVANDEFQMFNDRRVEAMASMEVYAGDDQIIRNGETITIEGRYTGSTAEFERINVWASSFSMDTLFTMSWEEDQTPSGIKTNNYPYVVDGKTGKIIARVEPHWPMVDTITKGGYGARVNAASYDGSVLVGHSANPRFMTNWAPVFWDLKAGKSFFIGTDELYDGSLTCINADGTIMGGWIFNTGILVYYDRENQTFRREEIPFAPGKASCLVYGFTADGLVLCEQAISSQDGGRETFLYDPADKSLVLFSDYLCELYGLKMPIKNFTASCVSRDGRMFSGWSYYGNANTPYFIQLNENQIFAKPRSLSALQKEDEMTVRLSWTAPMEGQYTLKGYNVFCDGEKLNAELIDKAEISYTHERAPQGVHVYTMQAVYEEGESAQCDPLNILIIAAGGCLPVQEMGHHLTYNRNVEVYWGLPSARMSQSVEAAEAYGEPVALVTGPEAAGRMLPAAKSYLNPDLDLIAYKVFNGRNYSSVLLDGDRMYAAQYGSTMFRVLNMNDMSVLESYDLMKLAEVSNVSNMVRLGNELYVAQTGKKEIVVLDIATMQRSNRIVTDSGVNHLCYIPELDGGQGGFGYGNWTSIQFMDRYGKKLTEGVPAIDVKGLSVMGTAYYDGKLYIMSQTGTPQQAELYTVDFESGQYIGQQNLGDIRRLVGIEPKYGFAAGGLSVNTLSDGTVALAASLQFPAANSHVAFLELESAPKLLGYNLYRSKDGGNFEQVNPEGKYIEGLKYREDLTEPGVYVYKVEAVSEGDCSMMLDNVTAKVTIEPIGECAPPVSLRVGERAKAVRLDWDYQGSETGPGLVGFNIYRDGELLAEHLVDFKYTDYGMAKGNYTYRVEAFYNNSCTASQEAQIKVTYEGAMMPPAHVALTNAETAGNPKHYDVAATWELPYFEQPLALGYCNIPYSGTGLQSNAPMYTLVGWDTTGLEPFKDFYIVGIEYYIGEGAQAVDGLVYMNDTLAYTCPQPGRIREKGWNTLMFGRYFSMDQPHELLVGYKVTYTENANVAAFDRGPAVRGYGDLFSADGKTWTTLSASGINANWCINALVVDKRDLEEAAAASAASVAGRPAVEPVVKTMSLNAALALTEPKEVSTASTAAKSSSATVKLQGFNVYRNGEKVNESLLNTFAYTDVAVPAGEYDYEISAVYSGGEEVKSEAIYVELGKVANLPETLAESVRVFPNPARLYFRVEGVYTALEITDLSGKTLKRYTDGRHEIDATGLPSGLYVLRFTLADGTQRLQKIVLE